MEGRRAGGCAEWRVARRVSVRACRRLLEGGGQRRDPRRRHVLADNAQRIDGRQVRGARRRGAVHCARARAHDTRLRRGARTTTARGALTACVWRQRLRELLHLTSTTHGVARFAMLCVLVLFAVTRSVSPCTPRQAPLPSATAAAAPRTTGRRVHPTPLRGQTHARRCVHARRARRWHARAHQALPATAPSPAHPWPGR